MTRIYKTVVIGLLAVVACSAVAAGTALASGKPFVETTPATGVNGTEANLRGVVNPNGAETKYHFDYGTSLTYGFKTPEVSAGSGTSNLEEAATVKFLTKSTTYHFRIVATNSNGTTNGADQVFKTTSEAESGCPRKAGAKNYFLCVEGKRSAETVPFKLTLKEKTTTAFVEKIQGTSERTIKCEGESSTGSFSNTSPVTLGELHLKLEQCKGEKPPFASCHIPHNTLTTEQLTGNFGGTAESVAFTRPESTFLKFAFKAEGEEGYECTEKGFIELKLSGAEPCRLSEAETEQVTHLITCKAEESHLLGWNTASHEVWFGIEETIALTGLKLGKKFSIIEGT